MPSYRRASEKKTRADGRDHAAKGGSAQTSLPSKSNGATLGFEQALWAAADKLRGHMDAAEYKHVVLGLIFLKYISDAFQEKYQQLTLLKHTDHANPEDRDEYTAHNDISGAQEA